MSDMNISVAGERREWFPGETMEGVASWDMGMPVKSMELRLFWYTRGKGTEDIKIVEIIQFENPQSKDSREFQINLPFEPYSFSGKLITLKWALELVPDSSSKAERYKFSLSQTGQPVKIGREETGI
ncbi:MAG: hypothetical protein JXQ25_07190 [Deltaproteobacteria bacterium]|nr:hypothetical protein [Deltaproteobacteria bacterium]